MASRTLYKITPTATPGTTANRQAMRKLYDWHKAQTKPPRITDHLTQASALKALAKIQPQLPDVPLHVVDFLYL